MVGLRAAGGARAGPLLDNSDLILGGAASGGLPALATGNSPWGDEGGVGVVAGAALFAGGVIAALDDSFFYQSAGAAATLIEADRLRALSVVVGGTRAATGVELIEGVVGVLVDEGAAVGAAAALDLDGFLNEVLVGWMVRKGEMGELTVVAVVRHVDCC